MKQIGLFILTALVLSACQARQIQPQESSTPFAKGSLVSDPRSKGLSGRFRLRPDRSLQAEVELDLLSLRPNLSRSSWVSATHAGERLEVIGQVASLAEKRLVEQTLLVGRRQIVLVSKLRIGTRSF